jgi:predicted esterase
MPTGRVATRTTEARRTVAEPERRRRGTLILLHGDDDDPGAFLAPARRMAPDGFDVIVPEGPVRQGSRASWWETDEHGAPDHRQVATSVALVDDLVASNADDGAVVLAGFSQGAALALLWALRGDAPAGAPVDGLAAVAGWLPTVDGIDVAPASCRAERVLIAHGADDDVVPLPLGRSVARLLERHHHEVRFVERDVRHVLDPWVDDVRAWLAERA